jgi:hypothetical protein
VRLHSQSRVRIRDGVRTVVERRFGTSDTSPNNPTTRPCTTCKSRDRIRKRLRGRLHPPVRNTQDTPFKKTKCGLFLIPVVVCV